MKPAWALQRAGLVVRRAVRNPLPAAQMRPRLVEIEHVAVGDLFELVLAEEEHAVECLCSRC